MEHTSTRPRYDALGYYPCRTCYTQWKATPGYQPARLLEQYCDLPVLWRVARLAQFWRIGKLKKIQDQHHSFEAEAVRRMARKLRAEAEVKVAKRHAKTQRELRLYVNPDAA